jgi:cytoskeletal protein CcmA (bactofilin family)
MSPAKAGLLFSGISLQPVRPGTRLNSNKPVLEVRMKSLFVCSVVALCLVAWAASPEISAAHGRSLSNVNGSIRAEAGQTYDSLSTVNGDVRVGSGAIADEAKAVNGDVELESDARLGSVSSVNGSLRIGAGAAVTREVSTVNGNVSLAPRARVDGDVSTVSGEIELRGAEVAGTLRSVNGDIDLVEGAQVRGGIHIRKNRSSGWGWNRDDPPRISICSTCVVEGELRFDRPVELHVEQGGKIGRVVGDSVKRL